MDDQLIFQQLKLNRSRTLEAAASVTEEEADRIPNGFNNNIRWQLGHILTTQERMAFRFIGEPLGLPEELTGLFVNGTKPADWTSAPPDLATLRRLLEEQPERIRERLQGRLQTPLTLPFKDFTALEEALVFSIGHEAMHAGFLKALHRITAAAQ
ncbi:hypothetical protein J31TS4_31150 [Paenibacillus sp. J31TS4]|uniref:DinB family protein n=1 Tax=Paenibacillus sp. J31TS4 TaxID=2807195 RepID=UPI001B279442|nr:DinB family protein [Paenibacillus sp. J31TS4]GIP39835.1 hypothetical protein J31TS4_31150 [Paenibacillus sp. J31TS4]